MALALVLAAAAPRPAGADDVGGGGDLEDILGGFEDEEAGEPVQGVDDDEAVGPGEDEGEEEAASEPSFWDRFDLTGSVSLAATYNYRDHHSRNQPLNTDWQGVSRLRNRLNLQLDVDLVEDWKARIAGYISYDYAYHIEGRSDFTHQVLNDYETDYDTLEVWVEGSLLENLDLKIGRQIVNWGRSDSLRVVDVINPLDNREPGLADIEDLRRPVGMARADLYFGDWSVTALVIPELRFDRDPPFGSDFNPSPIAIPTDEEPHWGGTPEFGGSIDGIFSGWDVSLYGGWFLENRPVLEIAGPPPAPMLPPQVRFEFARFGMVGAGGNVTHGSFLFKAELAYFIDRKVQITGGFRSLGVTRDQIDGMFGVEYYGFADHSLSLEFANRRILGFDSSLDGLVEKNAVQWAARWTADWMHSRLHTTALGIVFGERAQGGSAVRLEANYDLRDALVVGGGILLFQSGDEGLFEAIARNDRIFAQIKYSF